MFSFLKKKKGEGSGNAAAAAPAAAAASSASADAPAANSLFVFASKKAYASGKPSVQSTDYDYLFKMLLIGDSGVGKVRAARPPSERKRRTKKRKF